MHAWWLWENLRQHVFQTHFSGVPETFFIDRQGIVRSADRGGLTPARLSEGLSRIGIKWP